MSISKFFSEMTYYVSSGTLNPTHSLTTKPNPFTLLCWEQCGAQPGPTKP